jgi:hypothetical protein
MDVSDSDADAPDGLVAAVDTGDPPTVELDGGWRVVLEEDESGPTASHVVTLYRPDDGGDPQGANAGEEVDRATFLESEAGSLAEFRRRLVEKLEDTDGVDGLRAMKHPPANQLGGMLDEAGYGDDGLL